MRAQPQSYRSRSLRPLRLELLEDRSVPSAYALTDLGTFGGANATPYDINESGQLVGSFRNAPGLSRAFLWDDGVMTVLPTLGGDSSEAFDINESGQVVGLSTVTPGDFNTRHAFLWDSVHGIQDLGSFGATWSSATAINNAGQIVGSYSWPDRTRGYLLEAGVVRDLFLGSANDINDAGQVAATWESTRGYPVAATWNPVFGARELGNLPGGVFSAAYGLNEAGQVVGYSQDIAGADRAVLWAAGQVIDLGTLNPNVGFNYAVDINNAGQVVGSAGGAFVWSNGVMADLNDLVPSGSGLILDYAYGINDAGQIVAAGRNSQGSQRAVLLTPQDPNTPLISIGDVTVTEGHSGTRTATFTVTLSTASTGSATVAFATANGTATAGSDYQTRVDTITFAPGELTKSITVPVNGDRIGEQNETFLVNLTGATGGLIIGDGQGVGTIVDDEPRISINNVSKTEGNSGTTLFVFTVTLSVAYDAPVTVAFQTANGGATDSNDYQAQSGTLTFAPGETTKTITVVVLGDKKREKNETFFLLLTDATGGLILGGQGVGTILNDD